MSRKTELQGDKRLHRATEDKRVTQSKYREAVREIARLEDEMAALFDVSQNRKVFKIKKREPSRTSEATAFAIASDWHIEEEVKASTVNWLNSYNLDIAKKRATTFFQRIERLVRKERQDVEINTLVLGLLGDFITGRIHEENLETCLLRPLDAILYVQELLASGIKFLLENTNLNLVVVCKVGNHSRMTRRVHASTERGNALEWGMYHSLKQMFEGERCTFIIEDNYHTYLPTYKFMVRLHHGHSVRFQGGVGGLTIPLHKAIHQWNLTKRADLDIIGHFHDHMNMRRFVVNGSLIGYNAFAVSIKAEFQPPSQAFFLLDSKRGKTVSMPILF